MPNVNDDGTIHASFIESFSGPPPIEVRFWPYDGGAARKTLQRAIDIIQRNIFHKSSSCNSYFSHLPNALSFDGIWSDPAFWINWDPRPHAPFRGATATTRPLEITISQGCLVKGTWPTVATIVHEMAHLAGAFPGGFPIFPLTSSASNPPDAAERSLLHCGLKGHFDPSAVGIQRDFTDLQLGDRAV
jgi:hypothetical protein